MWQFTHLHQKVIHPCCNLHIYTRRSYSHVAIYIFTPEGHTSLFQFTHLHQKVIHPCCN